MRLLIVVPWDHEAGGVTSVAGNLARYLQDRGHTCYFFNPAERLFLKKKLTKWRFSGFELRLILPCSRNHPFLSSILFPILFPLLLCQLVYLIKKNKIELINIHYPRPNSVYFGFCRWLLSVKLVTSVHGADLFPGGEAREKYSPMLRFLLYSSDMIVAPSYNFLNAVLKIFPFLKEKSMCVHNSVNIDDFTSISSRQSNNDSRKYLLCIAAHNEKKGLDVLIRAFATLKDTEIELKLVLVGDGPLRKSLEGLAQALSIQDRIEFTGWKTRVEVVSLLHNCELFILPSRSEPFGIAIIEALACKKPVISTTAGGIPEIIDSGVNGLLVEPDDPMALARAIISVLKDNKVQKRFGENGYITVQKRFLRENTGASYEQTFEKLLKDKSQVIENPTSG